MPPPLSQFTQPLPKLTLMGALDILVVAFLIYELILIVRGTRAAHILAGILTLIIIYNLSTWLRLDLLHSILSYAMPYMAVAVIILFQSEIRRTLARIGRTIPTYRNVGIDMAVASIFADKIKAVDAAIKATDAAQSRGITEAREWRRITFTTTEWNLGSRDLAAEGQT